MYVSEMKQVQAMNFNGISVMDCSQEKLIDICGAALQRFDDYQQLCADTGKNEIVDYFVNSYNELEKPFLHLKQGGLISMRTRNSIRLLIKETEKYASCELKEINL